MVFHVANRAVDRNPIHVHVEEIHEDADLLHLLVQKLTLARRPDVDHLTVGRRGHDVRPDRREPLRITKKEGDVNADDEQRDRKPNPAANEHGKSRHQKDQKEGNAFLYYRAPFVFQASSAEASSSSTSSESSTSASSPVSSASWRSIWHELRVVRIVRKILQKIFVIVRRHKAFFDITIDRATIPTFRSIFFRLVLLLS